MNLTAVYSLTQEELEQLKQSQKIPVKIAGKAEYSPTCFLMFSFLSRMDFYPALFVWECINFLALLFSTLYLSHYMRKNGNSYLLSYAISLFVLLSSQPLLECIGIGQVNIIILLLLLILHKYIDDTKYDFVTAICLSTILLAKPQFGILFVLFFVRRRFTLCVYTIYCYILLRLPAIIVYGYDIEVGYWINLVKNFTHTSQYINLFDLSIKSLFLRLLKGTSFESFAQYTYIIAAGVIFVVTFLNIIKHKQIDWSKEISISLCCILLVSPLTAEHHLLLMAIPFIVLITQIDDDKISLTLLTCGFLLINTRYSLSRFAPFMCGLPSIFAFAKTFGVLMIWYQLLRTLSSNKESENIIQYKGE